MSDGSVELGETAVTASGGHAARSGGGRPACAGGERETGRGLAAEVSGGRRGGAAVRRTPLARAPSPALVLAAIASVQLGGALSVRLFGSVGPGGTVLLRLTTASVVLLCASRPRLRSLRGRRLGLAALFGAVLAAMNLCFYESLDRIPLGITVSLEFVGPLAVAVGGSRRRLDLLWVALALAGIAALTRGQGHVGATGVVFALAAGSLWGCYILLSARLGRAFQTGSGLAVAMCVGAALVAPVGIASGGVRLLAPRSLALGAAVGVLSSALPYSFELEALRRIRPSVFGVLMSLEPAVAALAGLVVLGQGLGGRALAGIALVIAASGGASRRAHTAPADV
ncbi:MAG TPA: EamA family transporter [Solirubrobacteraceae bacterium]|nr:EamA family transporter [Solirubrobacteraceae bacterium]